MSASPFQRFVPFLAVLGSVTALGVGTSWAKQALFPVVGAQGTTLATTTDTVLDPRPKVTQVTDGQRSYFGGGTVSLSNGLLVAAVYEVGPITQEFPGGGYAQDDVAPPSGYTKRVTVVLEGPEFTTGGEEFAVDAADFTRPQRGMLRVVRARQGA
mgnify:CR=1 FL=1